jgi:hypothetical protein
MLGINTMYQTKTYISLGIDKMDNNKQFQTTLSGEYWQQTKTEIILFTQNIKDKKGNDGISPHCIYTNFSLAHTSYKDQW